MDFRQSYLIPLCHDNNDHNKAVYLFSCLLGKLFEMKLFVDQMLMRKSWNTESHFTT